MLLIAIINNYAIKTGTDFSRWTLSQLDADEDLPSVITSVDRSLPTVSNAGYKTFIIRVYPSIISGNSLYIQIGNAGVQKMKAKVFDVNGRIVLNRQLSYQSQWLICQT